MIAIAVEPDTPEPLEKALGHVFEHRELLHRALTHRSFSNEQGESGNYERLEFLGDSVLGLVTARWLFERLPEAPEGDLAKLKGYLVSAPVLAGYARAIGLGERLRLGVGEDRSGGRDKDSILADAVEALFGAVYLDAGFKAARRVIEPVLRRALEAKKKLTHTDSKTLLQELSQARGWGLPVYEVVEESGPDHRKSFTVECRLKDEVVGQAEGRSKKSAAQSAAAQALAGLGLLDGR
jgi:ribonuclease-3